MSFLLRRSISLLISAVLFLALIPGLSAAGSSGSRDIIWEMVSNCLDPNLKDYCKLCRWPIAPNAFTGDDSCGKTTEVWAKTTEFVAIRDRKMCGCPEDFVHGLAIPLHRITGVEDPLRPDGIWEFAWTLAKNRIDAQTSIALAVNPPARRSQDQLHVHIVRLRTDARLKLARKKSAHICCLEGVWEKAAELASDEGLNVYGVLVFRAPGKGYMVIVDKNSPEELYTEEKCH